MFHLAKCQSIIAEYLMPRTDAELSLLLRKASKGLLPYGSTCDCLTATIFGEKEAIAAVCRDTWLSDTDQAYVGLALTDEGRQQRLIPLVNTEFARRFAARYEFSQLEERVQEAARSLTELIDRRRAEEREEELVTA